MGLLTTTLLHVVIDVKWGIASPADPSILKVRWILSNSIMIDIIKIRGAQHGISSFLNVSIDCFSVSLCVCVHVFLKAVEMELSLGKRRAVLLTISTCKYIFLMA